MINIGTLFINSETEVDAAATTTNGLYYDIVTLTNETTSDTTDRDDQGSQNNIHSYYGGVIGGGVTFVLFVGVMSCTCILLVRQRAKTRKQVLDQRNATNLCRCEGEFEGSNFSTNAMLMARNFAYSSSSCSQMEVDSVRRSCSTMMEENSAYNPQIADTFIGTIPMQANSAYSPVVLSELQTVSANYKLNQQNATNESHTVGDAYYDTVDSVDYLQVPVYGGAQSENSVVENDSNTSVINN